MFYYSCHQEKNRTKLENKKPTQHHPLGKNLLIDQISVEKNASLNHNIHWFYKAGSLTNSPLQSPDLQSTACYNLQHV